MKHSRNSIFWIFQNNNLIGQNCSSNFQKEIPDHPYGIPDYHMKPSDLIGWSLSHCISVNTESYEMKSTAMKSLQQDEAIYTTNRDWDTQLLELEDVGEIAHS